MKVKKFGFFFSIKNIDKNIDIYRKVIRIMKSFGAVMYKPDIIDNYPNSLKKIKTDGSSLVEGTQRQLRSVDFAIAYFTDKSRVVFFQTIMALENKIPVLCLVHEGKFNNFP